MKVYVKAPHEDWIVDRFTKEWTEDNSDITVNDPYSADVIWLFADWTWRQLPYDLLQNKRVVTTVHHIVPEKFGRAERDDFLCRDQVTNIYHVPNEITQEFIRQYTEKPIRVINYWANQKIWKHSGVKGDLRKRYRIPSNAYVCGSFQRDTEGAGIPSGIYLPKLEKGPDLLCDFFETIWKSQKDLYVILGGWRRQYVISRLEKIGIPYSYFEKPSQEIINDLYQTLDLYPITARHEGGPQSLIECGLLNIPVVCRPIGIASQVLSLQAINDDVSLATPKIPIIDSLKLPQGYSDYRKMLVEL